MIVEFPTEQTAPLSDCPVCGGRRWFWRLSEWEPDTQRRVEAVCGCMNGLRDTAQLLHDAIGRDAVIDPCNPELLATVQEQRERA